MLLNSVGSLTLTLDLVNKIYYNYELQRARLSMCDSCFQFFNKPFGMCMHKFQGLDHHDKINHLSNRLLFTYEVLNKWTDLICIDSVKKILLHLKSFLESI